MATQRRGIACGSPESRERRAPSVNARRVFVSSAEERGVVRDADERLSSLLHCLRCRCRQLAGPVRVQRHWTSELNSALLSR